jgi:DNA-binding response OmpR family regulator
MPKINLLIVEDDPGIEKMLVHYLDGEGFAVTMARSVREARERFNDQRPDMMVLDVGLPDGDGWEVLRWIRERSHLPVLMLTGRNDAFDRVVGLELGADDYVGKPFVLREVLARLRAIQRRQIYANIQSSGEPGPSSLKIRGLEIDVRSQQLRDESGTPIKLTHAEYGILVLLARAAGQVVTREKMMQEVAGRDWDPNDRSIDVHVSNLRKKLEAGANQLNLIRAVRGAGYMLITMDD